MNKYLYHFCLPFLFLKAHNTAVLSKQRSYVKCKCLNSFVSRAELLSKKLIVFYDLILLGLLLIKPVAIPEVKKSALTSN